MLKTPKLKELSFLVYGLGLSGLSVIKFLKKKGNKNFKVWDDKKKYLFKNYRAHNLKKTAIKVMNEYKGRLPKTIEELKTLPGIGDYTSKAIMSIVFNKKVIPLDGNVERILKRTLYLFTRFFPDVSSLSSMNP